MEQKRQKHSFFKSLGVFKSLIPYLSRYKWQYITGITVDLIVDAAQMVMPQLMRRAVDLVSSGDFKIGDVIILGALMVGCSALFNTGRFVWRYFIHGSSRRIETEMRDNLFSHLMTLSYDFYQKNKIGDLMARGTNDMNAVRMSIGMGMINLVDGVFMGITIITIIFIQDPYTAGYSVLPLIPIVFLIAFFGSAVGKRFKAVQESYSNMSDTVQETFAGIRVIKSFVKEWWFIHKFADTNDDYQEANMGLVKLFGVFFPLIAFLSGMTSLILVLVGGSRVVDGSMSAGDMVALFSYLQMLVWPIIGAGFTVNMLQRGAVSLGRINDIMSTRPAIRSPEVPASTPDSKTTDTNTVPAIEIRNMTFSYPNGSTALENISLSLEQGSILGILGKTGSGKSTLIKTLMRLVDPPPGTVLVRGIPVEEWDLGSLRGTFGVTPQDSFLFSDTIRNNIRYGITAAAESDEAEDDNKTVDPLLAGAAAVSAIDQDLPSFASGWETLIGERGLTLSGGQKQRVAISRSVIKEPPILILDDSLSAVDAETEKKVLDNLFNDKKAIGFPPLPRGGKLAVIVISHRVSTLQHCSKVLVLEKGRIAEYGSPRDLAAGDGFYARMARLQQLESGEDHV